jgi:hypothetical protein
MPRDQFGYGMVLRWGFALALTQIVGEPAAAPCVALTNRVFINSRPVVTHGAQNVLELVRRHENALRLGLSGASPRQPLVLVDGIALSGGVGRLSEIGVQDVVAVKVLRPREATARHGNRAADGAVDVVTKKRATACS